LFKLEQLAFVVKFVTYYGTIQEHLVALEVARDASGKILFNLFSDIRAKVLFNLFSDICAKYQLEWKKELIARILWYKYNARGIPRFKISYSITESTGCIYLLFCAYILVI
jgi:hypothetical protein